MPAAITDMTALAASLVHTPNQPTHVYLNFDGYQDDTHTVAAYDGSARTINHIIYRVSEIFSPLNVEVSRIYGTGSFDANNGNTTIFIGDDSANITNTGLLAAVLGGPDEQCRCLHSLSVLGYHPGETLGDQHTPHSNPYNLAFVDPVGPPTTNLTFTLPQDNVDWSPTT